ncbi:MAG: hypothetical protein HN368_12105 [Spirochaetales bacterium]|jgi:hypothetical protein|nr:hypothetical protein [Spirochaetales bacterium]
MLDNDIDGFWREREAEAQSRLVIPIMATYLEGYPGLEGPEAGLLYLMENGFYFENMEKKGQLDFFLRGKPRFVKKQFKLPLESVDGVDMIGAKVKASSPWQQFLDFWKTTEQKLQITFHDESGRKGTAVFECVLDMDKMQKAYLQLVKK